MGTELQKSLMERAKDFLQNEEDKSLFALVELLRKVRNNSHPDIFQGEELKKKAEDRFKDANALLGEVERQLEIERFNRNPNQSGTSLKF